VVRIKGAGVGGDRRYGIARERWMGVEFGWERITCSHSFLVPQGELAGWLAGWREDLTSRESGCRQWENKAATHPAYRHAATPTYIHFSQHPSTVRSIRPSLYT
jgi:hypothetical protein